MGIETEIEIEIGIENSIKIDKEFGIEVEI